MISADVFIRNFLNFLYEPGRLRFAKIAINSCTNIKIKRKKLVLKNKEFSCVERVKPIPSKGEGIGFSQLI